MATKIVHRLQLPYAAPEWPRISSEDENSIVQHLVDLLKPIGDHRRSNTVLSKSKRNFKDVEQEHSSDSKATGHNQKLPMPSISSYVTVGFNSTSRSLEALSQLSKPAILQEVESDTHRSETQVSAVGAVFVCRTVLPDLLIASIPLMVATASLGQPQAAPIRLVQLSGNAEGQFAYTLHQPRVGFVGVQVDAPNADVLLAIVRSAVSPVQAPWLDGLQSPRYLPAQIECSEASIGSKNKDKSKKATKHRERPLKMKPAQSAPKKVANNKPKT